MIQKTVHRSISKRSTYLLRRKALAALLMMLMPLTIWAQPTDITSLGDITNMAGNYRLTADVSGAGHSTIAGPFTGTLEAAIDPTTHMPYHITDLDAPLFATLSGTVKNLVIEGVSIVNNTGNTGAVACEASGSARIYNVGVLGGSVGGTGNTGGLVGLLEGTARVVNCYSFATITGGSNVGGIVGNNNATTTAASINTMVMNCMFYGDITGGTNKSPIYGGTNINNVQGGLNTFNYYAYDQLPTSHITSGKYNCALAVEEKYLNRFEFYRLLLNSNKKLAAFYVTGNVADANLMLKWVLETADRTIDNPKPYPILKAQGYYPSIINPDFANAPDSATVGRNHGGKVGRTLSVTISSAQTTGGQTKPTGATITTASLTLQRTDKDFDRFNYNYDKVQLPYYNDVGTGNYTGNRVVTGWKITAITAVPGDPYTSANYPTTGIRDFPDHNYADRRSSNKDLYSVSKRVFSQGAYFDVPYGVTSITIEPYWGKAWYLADQYYDVVYKNDYSGKQGVSQTGTQVTLGTTRFNGQHVETSITRALDSIANRLSGLGATVYDNALVLAGNLHLDVVPLNGDRHFTMMSVDEDNDHEPDYSLIYHHKGRTNITPIRFDFLNIPGTAQAQKPNGASLICNFTIVKTRGWFEITNTSLVHSDQFEYENKELSGPTKIDAPLILLGGIFDQFVSTQKESVDGKTIYIHVGGNVWIKEFGMGTHSDGSRSTPHVPVSVTGGEFPGFYLTGTYNADAAVRTDNAECYISGGYIHEAAGAALEQINGNVRWQIYNADIDNFFGGGTNDAKPIKGDVTTEIYNSHVTLFCGGPKFGNMQANKTVTTRAEGCVFGTYFGAGFGGTAITRKKYFDAENPNFTTLQKYYYSPGSTTDHQNERGKYYDGATTSAPDAKYGKKGVGVATDFDYEFFVWTSGKTGARFYIKFSAFSLAQCNKVSSSLKRCTIENNYYGGGSLGKVTDSVTSVLDSCIVKGNVFGAGYSASLPTLQVRNGGFTQNPNYNSGSGMFEPGIFTGTTEYHWKQVNSLSNGGTGTSTVGDSNFVHTTVDLNSLGAVEGNAKLTLNGTTVGTLVAGDLVEGTGNVYGGGEESNVQANTEVVINGASQVRGSVFGAGKGKNNDYDMARVEGNSTVTIGAIGAPAVLQNVYGGGEMASVGTYTRDGEGVVTGSTDGKGTATVTINGGTVGPVSVDPILFVVDEHLKGDVFGGGLGEAGKPNYAYVTNAAVTLNSGNVKGSVFGGGENGHVLKDAAVTIDGGTVGVRIPHRFRNISTDAGSSNPVYAGNVYGGGRGVDHTAEGDHLSQTAGRVYGNTSVSVTNGQVHHSVYGGGSLASVGTYTLTEDATIYGGYIHNFTENTGNATVTISGGRIGPTWDELLYDEAGNSLVDANGDPLSSYTYGGATGADDTIAKNYECLGENEGMVYGSGRGVNYPNDENEDHKLYVEMAFTNNTTVTISGNAMVIGSVFGGGENGHVKGNTQVNIQGGTIGGIPLHHNSFDLPEHTSGHGHIEDHNDRDDELNFNNTGIGRSVFRGNVYGGGRGIDHTSGNPSSSAAHIFSLSAGRVYGNTEINITDGRVLHNVFGGGSIASVGTYIYPNNDFFDNPEAALSNTGKTTVNVSGGQIGVMGENEGFVYGGGRGIAGTSEAQVGHLSFVNETEVNIESDEVNSRHADIRAAVFGGGMNGHVLTNTQVNISGGVVGGKTAANYGSGAESYDPARFASVPARVDTTIHGTAYYSGIHGGDTITRTDGTGPSTVFLGNVYGGGRGVDTATGANLSYTAGRVYGNTEVNITGGIIYHSVFGGGSIASVGNYEVYTPADTIADHGDEAKKASCYRLVAYQPKVLDTTDIEPAVGRHRNSYTGVATVHISGGRIGTNGRNNGRVFGSSRGMAGTAYRGLGYVNIAHVTISGGLVKGSVFGSGENGHVLDSTRVVVSGGHIGNGKRTDTPWLNHYIGNVYGGGRGLDRDAMGGGTVSPFAGRVYRNTKVEISGGQIDHNVYGGGSLASVGRYRRNMSAAAVGTDNYNVITYADADSGICRVTISGGTIGIDGDENGHVYGSSRGTSVSGSDIRANLAYTADTRVNIQSGATIKGSVFGGGESGHVQRDAHVIVSGGTIGLSPGADYDGLSAAAKARYDLMGNVYGGGRGVDTVHTDDNVGYSMSAGYVRGRTYVAITGTPTIYRNVYGGGSMGIVGDYGPYARQDFWQGTTPASHTHGTAAVGYSDASNGTATVVIKGTVGTATDHDSYHYGGNVYGASRGQANDPSHDATLDDFYAAGGFGEMAYATRTHVLVDTNAEVYGNVYGGGENGHVDFAGTTVDVLNGHVYGNVFGGGKGSATSPTAGIVDGPTTVNIGSVSQTTPIEGDAYGSYNTVEIGGDVFAGNDAHSSPLGQMTVNVYHTRHNASNQYPTTVPENFTALDALPHASSNFALHGIYGGGNLASSLVGNALVDGDGVDANSDGNADHVYDSLYITQRLLQDLDDPAIPSGFKPWPDTTRKSTVNIFNCDNTVMYVYGGGRAADTRLNEVTIEGGYVYKAFGGGNGDPAEVPGNPGANVLRTATINIYGGLIRYVFGGSNTQGEIGGSSSVVMEKTNVCDDELIGETFGAGNAADFEGDINITVGCGTVLEALYGGANEADIDGNVTLTVEGGVYTNVFGGSKGTALNPADITGNVTLNIRGGSITNAFGGSDVNGNIGGTITVNVDIDPDYSCADPLSLTNVYGGGRNAAYTPTDPSATGSNHSPVVNIKCGTVLGDVFGGAFGSGATCTSHPKVVMGLADGTMTKAIVLGNIYGGGSAAAVTGNTCVLMQSGTVEQNIFGGGLGTTASVSNNTEVGIVGDKTKVEGNVYGGGNAGAVGGNTDVYIGEKPE